MAYMRGRSNLHKPFTLADSKGPASDAESAGHRIATNAFAQGMTPQQQGRAAVEAKKQEQEMRRRTAMDAANQRAGKSGTGLFIQRNDTTDTDGGRMPNMERYVQDSPGGVSMAANQAKGAKSGATTSSSTATSQGSTASRQPAPSAGSSSDDWHEIAPGVRVKGRDLSKFPGGQKPVAESRIGVGFERRPQSPGEYRASRGSSPAGGTDWTPEKDRAFRDAFAANQKDAAGMSAKPYSAKDAYADSGKRIKNASTGELALRPNVNPKNVQWDAASKTFVPKETKEAQSRRLGIRTDEERKAQEIASRKAAHTKADEVPFENPAWNGGYAYFPEDHVDPADPDYTQKLIASSADVRKRAQSHIDDFEKNWRDPKTGAIESPFERKLKKGARKMWGAIKSKIA